MFTNWGFTTDIGWHNIEIGGKKIICKQNQTPNLGFPEKKCPFQMVSENHLSDENAKKG